MHDVIIIGGSYAGLSAGLQLARARKRILVIDAGHRRNRFAQESHGFLAQDGRPPQAIAEDARRQLLAYPTVDWLDGKAVEAGGEIDAFHVTTEEGTRYGARRLILATGVVDVLPQIPGLAEQWGTGAMTCPYCHGYELNGGPLAVIATSPMAVHHATIVSEWGPVTFFPNGAATLTEHDAAEFAARGISVNASAIRAIEGAPGLPRIVTADGTATDFAGVFVTTTIRFAADIASQLGCETTDTPIGQLLKVDGMQATSVPGVFACGDAASPMASIALSVGSGAMAGAATHRSLIMGAETQKAA